MPWHSINDRIVQLMLIVLSVQSSGPLRQRLILNSTSHTTRLHIEIKQNQMKITFDLKRANEKMSE